MRGMRLFLAFVVLFLTGCANLRADRFPALRLTQAHPFGATVVAYNRAGDLLATGGFDGTLRIWRMPQGIALISLKNKQDIVRGIAWIDDDDVVSATEDGTLTIWNLRTHEARRVIATAALKAMVGVPASANFLVAYNSGALRVYSAAHLSVIAEHLLDAAPAAIAVSRDGQTIAVATDDRAVRLLNSRLQVTKTLSPATRDVLSLRFSPDGKQLAAGTWFKLLLWDMRTGQQTERDTEHFGAIVSIDYTPDGKDMISLGRISDSSLRLTDVATGRVRSRMAPLPLCGWMVRISPDGHYAAAGSESGDVDLFDLTQPPPR